MLILPDPPDAGILFRPPAEADSLLLRITVGCSVNRCDFCSMYRDVRFRARSEDEVATDLALVPEAYALEVRRVFLADGDAFILPASRLRAVLDRLRARFPALQRVGIYATPQSILRKKDEELRDLRARGLRFLYVGIESGDPETLARIGKGATREQTIEATTRARSFGFTVSATVLIGIGGVARSREHAAATASALSLARPNYINVLTSTVYPGTPLETAERAGRFEMPDDDALREELLTLVSGIDAPGSLFFANHASNLYPVEGRLNRDRDRLHAEIAALAPLSFGRRPRDGVLRGGRPDL